MDSVKYIGNAADANSGIYHINEVNAGIKDGSWPTNYKIENSLRFEGGSYLSRTPTIAGTSYTTFTYSFWVKKSVNSPSDIQNLFEAKLDGNDYLVIFFQMTDEINIHSYHTSKTGKIISTAKYRDNSSWYHIIFTCDTTNTNGNDRYKLFVNGDRVINLSSNINPTVNYSTYVNTLNQHRIGLGQATTQKFYGYMANIHLIDGQALDPSHFATTHPVTGRWVPKPYRGTYGTNGFHLEFKNTGTHTGVGGIGEDTSGNGNHWAVTGLAAHDIVPDSPTNNFATLNPLMLRGGTLSEGNLKLSGGGNYTGSFANLLIPKTGKYYVEVRTNDTTDDHALSLFPNNSEFAITNQASPNSIYITSYGSAISVLTNNNSTTLGSVNETATTSGDVHGYLVDVGNRLLRFYKNGVHKLTLTNWSPLDLEYAIGYNVNTTWPACNKTFNFGQDPTFAGTETPTKTYSDANNRGKFLYQPPGGALALCEANINQTENTVSEYVVDETGNHMLTNNGGVDISKFSPYAPDGYSIAFAGNSQQLKFATSADFELTGDATVEMWVYLNSAVTGNTPLYGYGNDAGTNYFSLHIAADGRLQWYQHGSLSGIESTASVGIRRWHHIALVKDGTSLKVYNNGKEVISSSYT